MNRPPTSPAAGARLTRARAGAGKALDKPKIELCSEGDADCEMGTIKVPPPPTPTPPRRGSSLAPAQPAAHNPHSGAAEPARALLLGAAFPAPPPDPCPAGVAGHLLALRHLHLHPVRCGPATPPAVLRPSSAAARAAGLGLKTDDVKTALAQGKAIIYAFVSINLITGLFAFIMVQLPFGKNAPRSHYCTRETALGVC